LALSFAGLPLWVIDDAGKLTSSAPRWEDPPGTSSHCLTGSPHFAVKHSAIKLPVNYEITRETTALLSGAAVGLPMTIYCRVTLDRQDKAGIEGFAKAISDVPEVLECHLMAGSYDYLLKVAAASLDDYQRFQMQHLTPLPGVRNVVTEIPLKTIKGVSSLPV